MKHGTKADYKMLHELEKPYMAGTARRLMKELASQADETITGYKVTRLEHALQSAIRAWREGADKDFKSAAILRKRSNLQKVWIVTAVDCFVQASQIELVCR